MTTRNVVVKWGKTKLDLSVDLSDTYETFKAQLFALSGVPMERQKIMGFKGTPKDGTTLQSLGVKEGQVFMMIGSADSVQAPSAKTVFVEDMAPSEVAAQAVLLPPGLRNVGNTCYMNSTVQMLGSIPELREIIIRNPAKDADLRAQMVKSLGTLFGMLAHSHQPVVPLQFYADMIRAYPQFGEVDEKSNVPRQQDAEECWTSIFMSIIQKVAAEQRLKFLFEGELEATYTCKEAVDETPSVVKDPFYKLSCNIDNSISHMIDGLKLNMSGEVEKRSPSLNREAIYTKKQLISRLPKYITVQFVRFFWKKTAQGKTKITKAVGIPQVLDLFELCTPTLKERLGVKRRALLEASLDVTPSTSTPATSATTTSTTTTSSTESPTPMDTSSPATTAPVAALPVNPENAENDTGQYTLKAVVTHKGIYSDGGHYVAWVKQDDDSWLLFDDDKVRVADPSDIAKLDGKGGAEWHIAYLCLYATKSS